jgi:hypothetical protein
MQMSGHKSNRLKGENLNWFGRGAAIFHSPIAQDFSIDHAFSMTPAHTFGQHSKPQSSRYHSHRGAGFSSILLHAD